MTAVLAGKERAITAAQRNVSAEDLEATLPLLQKAVLSNALEREAHHAHLKLSDLRNELASALGTTAPEPVQLTRVKWMNVVMIALMAFAAYALVTALAEIGFDTIIDELSNAEWSWILIAFVLAQLTNVGEYISLSGMVDRPVPFGPTIMFRYAISFISLAVPSDAGAIAMNVRYMQKMGVPTPAALAQGPMLVVVSKAFDVVLLFLSFRYVGPSLDLDDVDAGPVLKLVAWVVIGVVIGGIVMFSVPKLRNKVLPPIKEAVRSVKDAMTDPPAPAACVCRHADAEDSVRPHAEFLGDGIRRWAQLRRGHLREHRRLAAHRLHPRTRRHRRGRGRPDRRHGRGRYLARSGGRRRDHPSPLYAYLPPVFGAYTSKWLTDHDYLSRGVRCVLHRGGHQ